MKIRIEVEHDIRTQMNFDEWLGTVTEQLCEWTEKHKVDKDQDCWIIEIEGR